MCHFSTPILQFSDTRWVSNNSILTLSLERASELTSCELISQDCPPFGHQHKATHTSTWPNYRSRGSHRLCPPLGLIIRQNDSWNSGKLCAYDFVLIIKDATRERPRRRDAEDRSLVVGDKVAQSFQALSKPTTSSTHQRIQSRNSRTPLGFLCLFVIEVSLHRQIGEIIDYW